MSVARLRVPGSARICGFDRLALEKIPFTIGCLGQAVSEGCGIPALAPVSRRSLEMGNGARSVIRGNPTDGPALSRKRSPGIFPKP